MSDVFRPHREPAQAIYDAFQQEAANRAGRTVAEWLAAERHAVHEAARRMAVKHSLRSPTLEDVMRAEQSACGHVDYGAKWAYRLCELMAIERQETRA